MASDKNPAKPVVKIALVGFGRAGHMHLSSIRSNHRCVLKYVVELAGEREEGARQELARLNMTDSVTVVPSDRFDSVILADPDLNAVMITTPTDQHEVYIVKSIAAGKAVFCEKPIAESIDTVRKCYEEAEKAKLPLFCAFNRRFDPTLDNLRERVRGGELGKVHCISTTSRDSPLPSMSYLKISNGMYHDCAVHDIDTICWILGEEPSHVYAQGHAQKKEIADINDVDTVVIVLTFPSGVLASVNLSRHSSYGYDQRIEVLGDKGMLSIVNPHSLPLVSSTAAGINLSPYQYSFPERYEASYRNELHHFIDCIQDPSLEMKVNVNDTIRVTRIAQACERSAVSKKAELLET